MPIQVNRKVNMKENLLRLLRIFLFNLEQNELSSGLALRKSKDDDDDEAEEEDEAEDKDKLSRFERSESDSVLVFRFKDGGECGRFL